MNFKSNSYKLSNGIRVLEIPMLGSESTSTLVLAKTGSRNEEESQAGISHVLEHMVFKGTESFETPKAIAEAVDSLGAEFNAFTGKEYTGYYIKAAGEHFKRASHILSEMIVKPLLRDDDLEREKGVIIEEINMYEDLPMERAGEEFENIVFSGNLGRLIIGSKETVSSLNSSDLREYMNRWYRGSNLLIVVSGKVGKDTREVLEKSFSQLGNGEMLEYVSGAELGTKREIRIHKKTEQAHFVVGVPALSMSDERRFALTLGRIALGGNMSSRLFSEVREKRGWAYYVRAVKEEHIDTGYLAVRAGVKLDVVEEAIELVKSEMVKIVGDISQQEVERARDYLKGVFTLSMESSLDVAKYLGEAKLLLDEEWDVNEILTKIDEAKFEEVRSILKELIRVDEMRVAVVGPKS